MSDHRRSLGHAGESVAAWLLHRHGLSILDRNVTVGNGEVDIVARHGRDVVVVEVRTVSGPADPLDAFGAAKANQVASLAGRLGADRVDLVALRLTSDAAEMRWVRSVA